MNSYDVDLNFAFKLGVINHFEYQIEILGKSYSLVRIPIYDYLYAKYI